MTDLSFSLGEIEIEIEYEYSPTWTFFDYFKALYECNTVNNVLASCLYI